MARSKAPRVVAELGRPETPEETAARKAEASARRRRNQTAVNLFGAVIASLGIVLFLVLVVVRPDGEVRDPVDYRAVAEQSQPGVAVPLAVPELPETWQANSAGLEEEDGVQQWQIGLLTPADQYIRVNQGLDADDAWLASAVDDRLATGTTSIDGVEWTVYDHRAEPETGNFAYALSTEVDGAIVVLNGTAETAEFEQAAAALELGSAA